MHAPRGRLQAKPQLDQLNLNAAGVFGFFLQQIFCFVQQSQHVIKEGLSFVHFIVNLLEASIFGLMSQLVGPATLQFYVIANLLNHLVELTGVNSVGAHNAFLSLRGRL